MTRILSGIAILWMLAFAVFCGLTVFDGLSLQADTFGAALVLSICLSPYIVLGLIALVVALAFALLTKWRNE